MDVFDLIDPEDWRTPTKAKGLALRLHMCETLFLRLRLTTFHFFASFAPSYYLCACAFIAIQFYDPILCSRFLRPCAFMCLLIGGIRD